ncbi:MAG: hypothetical protein PHU45_05575 [Bacilli bacterium]|nr:hypothetical protein [Bacilli bacterium]
MEKNYKINPKWELILKTNKELLCVMKPKKTKKIKLTPNDIKQVTFILSNKKFY